MKILDFICDSTLYDILIINYQNENMHIKKIIFFIKYILSIILFFLICKSIYYIFLFLVIFIIQILDIIIVSEYVGYCIITYFAYIFRI
jgi:hypothetical protein